jgi:hypothetical protein
VYSFIDDRIEKRNEKREKERREKSNAGIVEDWLFSHSSLLSPHSSIPRQGTILAFGGS